MHQLVNLYNYYLLFMSNAFMLSAVWQSVKTSHGSSTTIAKLVDAAEEDLESGTSMENCKGNIAGNGIHFSYDGKRQVLSGVDFTIPAGKITAVVGENGCGKSTLIGLLERFQHEQSGQLLVDGAPLDDIRLKDWRENVGYLFQGNQIIQGTIRENITYGVHRAFTEEELVDAAKKAKAYNFIQEKENGFDTQISRFDNKYSGGEMQRIAIARMILKRPEILIMDEATSGIDVISEHEVMEALMNLMAGKTVIMVSHDMEMIRRADNLIVLNGGQVEASGDFHQVAAASPLFQAFLEKRRLPGMMICRSKAVSVFDYRNIDLGEYAAPFVMNEETLQQKLEKLRTRHGRLQNADSVMQDDFVTLNTESDIPKYQKTGLQLRVGKGLFSPELEQAILGMRTGGEETVSLPEGEVRVKICAVQRRVLPELTDETVSAWGIDGVSTAEELIRHLTAEAKAQYAEDMAESLTAWLSDEIADRSTFLLDPDEVRAEEEEGRQWADELLRNAGLDPEAADDDAVMAVSGKTKQEHYDFVRSVYVGGLKSACLGTEMMAADGVEITGADYQKALTVCAESMGGFSGRSGAEGAAL